MEIHVSESEIDQGAINLILPKLLDLMATAEDIVGNERAVAIHFPAVADPVLIRRFLLRVHAVWPLWLHFATPNTLVGAIRALVGNGSASAPERAAVLEFLQACRGAVENLYLVFGVSGDPERLMRDVTADLETVGMI